MEKQNHSDNSGAPHMASNSGTKNPHYRSNYFHAKSGDKKEAHIPPKKPHIPGQFLSRDLDISTHGLSLEPEKIRAMETEDRKSKSSASKSKTSLRMKYEAETNLIIKEYGDLELIRERLGLSRRQICQILLVDPSAWSRWTQKEKMAPPHIYRALQWYINLTEKHPSWHPSNSFHPKMAALTEGQIGKITEQLEQKVKSYAPQQQALANHMERKFEAQIDIWQSNQKQVLEKAEGAQAIHLMWKLLLLAVSILSFWLFLKL